MKFIIVLLVVTHKIDYHILDDYVFDNYRDCLGFQQYLNQNTVRKDNYVYWCGKKYERKNK